MFGAISFVEEHGYAGEYDEVLVIGKVTSCVFVDFEPQVFRVADAFLGKIDRDLRAGLFPGFLINGAVARGLVAQSPKCVAKIVQSNHLMSP